ncbi:hypothetical protein CHS0354_014695, partial [Potamilus streckersoni]
MPISVASATPEGGLLDYRIMLYLVLEASFFSNLTIATVFFHISEVLGEAHVSSDC